MQNSFNQDHYHQARQAGVSNVNEFWHEVEVDILQATKIEDDNPRER